MRHDGPPAGARRAASDCGLLVVRRGLGPAAERRVATRHRTGVEMQREPRPQPQGRAGWGRRQRRRRLQQARRVVGTSVGECVHGLVVQHTKQSPPCQNLLEESMTANFQRQRCVSTSAWQSRIRCPEQSPEAIEDESILVPTPKEITFKSSEAESWTRIAAKTVCTPSNVEIPRLRLYSKMDRFAIRSANGHVDVRLFSALRTAGIIRFLEAAPEIPCNRTNPIIFTYIQLLHSSFSGRTGRSFLIKTRAVTTTSKRV